jgi:hypothetical protein
MNIRNEIFCGEQTKLNNIYTKYTKKIIII